VYGKWDGFVVVILIFVRRIAVTGIFFVVAGIISIVEGYFRVGYTCFFH